MTFINPIGIGLFGALWYWGGWGVQNVPTDLKTPVKPLVFAQIK